MVIKLNIFELMKKKLERVQGMTQHKSDIRIETYKKIIDYERGIL